MLAQSQSKTRPQPLGIELDGGQGGIAKVHFKGRTLTHKSYDVQVFWGRLFLQVSGRTIRIYDLCSVVLIGDIYHIEENAPFREIVGYGSLDS